MVIRAKTRSMQTYSNTIGQLDLIFYCHTFDMAYDSDIILPIEPIMQMLLMGGEL
jgi:hypothetical protein